MKDNKLNYYFNYDQNLTQDVEVKLTQNAINKIKDNLPLNLNVFEGKIYKKIEIFDKSFELYGDVSIFDINEYLLNNPQEITLDDIIYKFTLHNTKYKNNIIKKFKKGIRNSKHIWLELINDNLINIGLNGTHQNITHQHYLNEDIKVITIKSNDCVYQTSIKGKILNINPNKIIDFENRNNWIFQVKI